MSQTILITGVAGFLGSHLSEALLSRGYRVVGVDNFDPFYAESIKRENLKNSLHHAGFTFVQGDIRDKSLFVSLDMSVDLVVHIAAKAGVLPSVKNPEEYVSVNISGTLNLLEYMREKAIRKYVFASSSSVYGNQLQVPFAEDSVISEPISPYAFTKRSCEHVNHTYHHLYGIDCLNLRLFTLYGPRQRPDLSIHKFVRLMADGQPIEMYGDGSTARDYTHVSDVVNGFVLAIEYLFANNKIYDTLNIGNKAPVKLADLIRMLYSAMQVPENIVRKPKQPGDVEITYADISKAEKMIGYSPQKQFAEGINEFVSWYREKLWQK